MLDAVVIGAGPAGSATAALLAAQGARVGLVDRAFFPRPKPCAEYVSPGSARLLTGLLGDALPTLGAASLHGMRIVSPDGTAFVGRFGCDSGYALRREVLDTALVEEAARRGAKLMLGATFESSEGSGDGRTVRLRTRTGAEHVRTRLLIGADGLGSRVARAMGVSRRGRLRRVAVVGHATGVTGLADLGEMHVTPFGYVGLAPLGGGLTNVSVVADLRRDAPGQPIERWALERLRSVGTLQGRVERASFVAPATAVGPFARRTSRATADRLLLVGDAADFHDPFTGEGIHAALVGAQLVAEICKCALTSDELNAYQLRDYDRERRRAFLGKWIVERLVSYAVGHQRAFTHVARRLAAHTELADRLVQVTAGVRPASDVLRPGYLWRIVR